MMNPEQVQQIIGEAVGCYARIEKAIANLQLAGAEVGRLGGMIAQRMRAGGLVSDAEFTQFRAAVEQQIVQLDSLTENTRRASECCAEFLKAADEIHNLWKLI